MARRLQRFIKSKSLAVKSIADVGCGPAIMLFELAPRLPYCDFLGFDGSRKVLNINRWRTTTEGLRNLRFEFARLPEIMTEQRFDIVTCIAALHYVRESRRAIRNLYSMLKPGGYLIFNYPNRTQRAAYQREAQRDPTVKQRFNLVLSGSNLLSREVIESTLQQNTESFWSAVGERACWSNPCVAVAKQ